MSDCTTTRVFYNSGHDIEGAGHQPQAGQAPAGALGNTRKLLPSAPSADYEVELNPDARYESLTAANETARQWLKLRRFALQSAARSCVNGNSRLRKCYRVSLGQNVGVIHNTKTKSAHYRGLTTCGSVWACPVCSAKVSERRREELGLAIKRWRSNGGRVWLVTLTFSHHKSDSLPVLLKRLSKAMGSLNNGRALQKARDDYGIVGQVRALEVTHGQKNGWHPHIHMLVFFKGADTSTKRESYTRQLFQRWFRACDRAGLGLPNETHGVRVDGYEKAGEYVTKWGLEHELTKLVSKEGRKKDSRTPMAILADYLDGGDLDDAALFAEYAYAFKGQRQLFWGHGLRDLLGFGAEVSDEELAAQDEQQAGDITLAAIPLPVWKLVLRAEVRGQLLLVASSGDKSAVLRFLRALPGAEGLQVDFFEAEI